MLSFRLQSPSTWCQLIGKQSGAGYPLRTAGALFHSALQTSPSAFSRCESIGSLNTPTAVQQNPFWSDPATEGCQRRSSPHPSRDLQPWRFGSSCLMPLGMGCPLRDVRANSDTPWRARWSARGRSSQVFALLWCVRWKGVEAGFVYFKAELPSLWDEPQRTSKL